MILVSDKWASETHTPTQGLDDTWRNFGVLLGYLCPVTLTYAHLVFTKSVDSNFCPFWLAPVTWNILGYSLFCERREKWRVVSRKFQEEIKTVFLYPSDLVNTKTNIPLRVGEERWICTSTPRVSRLGIYPPLFTSPSGDSCILFWWLVSSVVWNRNSVFLYHTLVAVYHSM